MAASDYAAAMESVRGDILSRLIGQTFELTGA
jgi:hypothetical protein